MASPDMHRAADAAHAAAAHATQVIGVHLKPDDVLLALGAEITRHRAERFCQYHRRAAMQQPERLMRAMVHRHGGFNLTLIEPGKTDIEQPDHIIRAHGVERLKRRGTLPDHTIIPRSACNGWRTPLPSIRFTWLRHE